MGSMSIQAPVWMEALPTVAEMDAVWEMAGIDALSELLEKICVASREGECISRIVYDLD